MKENVVRPDYNNCILNLTSSIMKHFGACSGYQSIGDIDTILSKGYKNVVLMVFDGMGIDMLEHNLSENSFLRGNMYRQATSVYPCTTTAAMTAYYSGLSPNEHGWLGWSLYFREYDGCIDTFTNQYSFTKTSAGEKHAAFTLMPYNTVFEAIDKATNSNISSCAIVPPGIMISAGPNLNIEANDVDHICRNIEFLCSNEGRKFIMSYWPDPDRTMHWEGCYVDEVISFMEYTDERINEMCGKIDDTVVIITADHGLIDISEEVFLNEIPEIDECLIMPPSIESRAASLFVRPEKLRIFEQRFNDYFGDDFILIPKEQVLKSGILGSGITHRKVPDFLGDFLACSIGNKMIRYATNNYQPRRVYRAQHAGLTRQEMLVPVIVVERHSVCCC